jgi:hypothetical protein
MIPDTDESVCGDKSPDTGRGLGSFMRSTADKSVCKITGQHQYNCTVMTSTYHTECLPRTAGVPMNVALAGYPALIIVACQDIPAGETLTLLDPRAQEKIGSWDP